MDFELSGNEDIEIGNNGITIVAANGNIVVNGVSDNAIDEVYNVSGQLVYSGYDNNIAIKNNGIYLVKVNNSIHKIAL